MFRVPFQNLRTAKYFFGGCRQRHSLNFFTPLTRQRMWREFQSLITNLWTNLATKWFYPRTETWKPAEIIKRENTFSNGCLGSHNDEERSEMRYVMRIAQSSESSKLWTQLALPSGSMSVRVSVHPHQKNTPKCSFGVDRLIPLVWGWMRPDGMNV